MLMDFILLNTTLISNGFDIALSRQKTLRPDFSGFGVTGIYMRPTGLFGTNSPHDSANMLAILFVYWLAMLFKNNKGFWSSMSMYVLFSFIALLLSMSASNIIAGFVGMVAVFFVYNKKIFLKKSTLGFGILIIPFFSWLYINHYDSIKLLWVFTERLGVKGDWKGLSSYYGNNTWNDLFSFIFGWGSSLDITRAGYYAEQALVKGLFEYGIFHSTVFYIFLLFPVFIYILDGKRLDKFDCFPYIIPIFVGFLSLWHYGSILRTTNIFVFYAIYAQFLRKDRNHRVYR